MWWLLGFALPISALVGSPVRHAVFVQLELKVTFILRMLVTLSRDIWDRRLDVSSNCAHHKDRPMLDAAVEGQNAAVEAKVCMMGRVVEPAI